MGRLRVAAPIRIASPAVAFLFRHSDCLSRLPMDRSQRVALSLPVKTAYLAALCTDLLSIAFAGQALAQAPDHPRYRVEIQAPRELRDMLKSGLNLIRWQNDEALSPTLLERLVDEAVHE